MLFTIQELREKVCGASDPSSVHTIQARILVGISYEDLLRKLVYCAEHAEPSADLIGTRAEYKLRPLEGSHVTCFPSRHCRTCRKSNCGEKFSYVCMYTHIRIRT